MAKKIVKGIITSIFLIVLSASLCLLALLWGVRAPLSREGIFTALEETGYTDGMKESLKADCKSLCQTSGIPEDLIASFVDGEIVNEVAYYPLEVLFEDKKVGIDYEKMQSDLNERITAYAKDLRSSGEMPLSDEEWAEMEKTFPETASYFVEEIRASVNLSGIYSMLGSALDLLNLLLRYLTVGSVFTLVFSLVMLFLIWKRKGLMWCYTSFAAAGLLVLIPSALVVAKDYVSRLGLEPIYLKNFVRFEVMSFCHRLVAVGGILLVVGILCGVANLIVSIILKKKKSSENLEEILVSEKKAEV